MTNNEQLVYDFILHFIEDNEFSPTITEIAQGTYFSRAYIYNLINRMKEKGFIKYQSKKVRTIVLLK